MSFFKKLKDEWKELIGDDDKDKKKDSDAKHAQDPSSSGQKDAAYAQPQQNTNQYNQPPQQYPQQPQSNYGQPPPQGMQLPPGWVQQWDSNSQRYYYIDPSTGRSQWDPPTTQHQGYGGPPPPANMGAPGYNAPSYPQGQYASGYPAEVKKEKSGKGGLIAAGVGGAAVGALGAAALSGDSSDDEHQVSAPYGAPPSGGYYSSAPPPAPVPLEDNPNLSSSQRSSLEEAREDMEEAEAKVRGDSSASSSDIEELEEAREEYASEVESAHEELED